MNTQLRSVMNTETPEVEPKKRDWPVVGVRWTSQLIERRDTQSGTFEMMNSRIDSKCEAELQTALLSPLRYGFSAKRIAEAQQAVHNIQGAKA